MTAQEAIRELQKVRNYCNATSIPAIDYAIEAILEKEDRASRESWAAAPKNRGAAPIRMSLIHI